MSYRVQAKDLDRVGASRLETEYAEERKDLPLRKKYRPNRATHQQWGVGGDRSGKGRPKGVTKHQEPPTHRKVLVIGPDGGRRRWVWVEL